MLTRFISTGLLFVSLLVVSGCSKEEAKPQTITDIVLSNNDFTLLRAAVQRAGLADALRSGTLTVFAPNDAAFKASGFADVAAINALPEATLKAVLQYHVLGTKVESTAIPTAVNTPQQTLLTTNGTIYITKSTSGVSVNGARVTQADIQADNGVIHVINKVLLPPSGNLLQALQSLAAANPNTFNLLIAAATRAGTTVLTALSTAAGPFTVMAPTNAAFQAANLGTQAAIDAAPVATLQAVLLYHVIPARAFSTNLASGTATTAQGGTFAINVGANSVTLTGKGNGTNAANVTRTDVVATNGVVHVIDRVLLPQ